MSLTRNQKIGIGMAVGAGALLLGMGVANADDTVPPDEDGDCPEGFVPQLQPDGSFTCVEIDIVIPAEPVDDDDDPLPPKPPQCNYAGCGPQFDNTHQHPSVYALRIQQLGYPINAAGVAANGTFLAVSPQRDIVREFQRDYNAVRAGDSYDPITNGPKLGTDGLVGNQTIAAIDRAHAAVLTLNLPWVDIVELNP